MKGHIHLPICLLRKRIRATPCFFIFYLSTLIDLNLGKIYFKVGKIDFNVDFSKFKVDFSKIKVDFSKIKFDK